MYKSQGCFPPVNGSQDLEFMFWKKINLTSVVRFKVQYSVRWSEGYCEIMCRM